MRYRHDGQAGEEIGEFSHRTSENGNFSTDSIRVLFPTHCSTDSQLAAQLIDQIIHDRKSEVTIAYSGRRPPPAQGSKRSSCKRLNEVRPRTNNEIPKTEDQSRDTLDDGLEHVISTISGSNTDPIVSQDIDVSDRDAILAKADENYDLLVICVGEYVPQSDEHVFEKVIDELIHESPCPVLIVLSNEKLDEALLEKGTIQHILLPIVEGAYSRRATEIAFTIASETPTLVTIAQWIYPPRMDGYLIRHQRFQEKIAHSKQLVDRIAQFGLKRNVSIRTDISISNRPERDIVAHAASENTDLLILSSENQSWSRQPSLSHWAGEVLRNSPCSVVVVSAADERESMTHRETSVRPQTGVRSILRTTTEQDIKNRNGAQMVYQKFRNAINRQIRPLQEVN